MKKSELLHAFIFLFSLFCGQTVYSQTIGDYYSFSESTGTYPEISGGTLSTASGDDGKQNNVPIGFSFEYVGTTYTTLTVGVNGAVSFTAYNIVSYNSLGGLYANYLNYLAPLWDDMYARTEDNFEIRYETAGTAPNRTFTVQWKNISWNAAGSTVNFQVVLYETSNNIVFNYGVNNSTESRSASIGINVSPGGSPNYISITPGSPATISTTYPNNSINTTEYPGNGHSYTFTYDPPTCFNPSNQSESNITPDSAYLEWTTGGSSTWNIEYGEEGFTKGTGTTISGTTLNPYPLGGLISNTSYDWYVQDDCGSGDTSYWVGPSTFTTSCYPFTATFTESFDAVSSPDIPDCWSKIVSSATGSSTVQTTSSYYPKTYPYHIRMYNSYDLSATLMLISPQLSDLSSQLNQIRFFSKGNETGHQLIVGTMTDPSDASTFTGKDTLILTDTYMEYTVIFGNNYSGSDEYIVFKHKVSDAYQTIFIDNFVYEPIPSCPVPTHLSSSNITPSGADLSWTDTYGSNWDIYITLSGGSAPTQSTMPTIDDTSSNPFIWTGGNAYTSYDWYVRSDCDHDNSGTSVWNGPNTFTTIQAPAPVQTLPFEEDWESGTIGTAWNYDKGSVSTIETNIQAAHNSNYGLRQYGNSNSSYSTPSNLADAYIKAISGGANEDWTTWNKFSVDLSGASSPFLTFWYSLGYQYSNNYNNFWVQVSTNDTVWTDLFSSQTNGSTIPYTKKAIDLSAYDGFAQVYIRFFHNGKYNTNYLYLDDISVEEVPCPDPTDQTVSNLTSSGADLSWVNPTGNYWDIYIVPEGDPAPTQSSTPTINDTTDNPFKWEDGDENTSYDWYVRSDCDQDNTGTSEWVGPQTFTTECGVDTIPYFQNFDDVSEPAFPDCMTVEDANGDNITWETTSNFNTSEPNAAVIEYNSNINMNDWFFTPGLELAGGVTYEVSFSYTAYSNVYPEKLAVDWGDNPNAVSMSGTPIFDDDNVIAEWKSGSGTFTPADSGVYYVGFHGYSDADEFNLYVDDIKILEEVATTTWNGSSDSNWDNPDNWSDGMPTSTTAVTIPTGLLNYPTLSSFTPVYNVFIESDATGSASLLNDDLLIIGDDVYVEQYISGGVWHDMSSPLQDQTLQQLYFNGNPDVWLCHYNEPDNSRTYWTNLTDTMSSGAGFEMWVESGNNVVVEYTGDLQTGDIDLDTLNALSYSGPDPLGYNLIGNPFASPVCLDSGNWNMSNVDSTFWVWDPSGAGSYKDYNTKTSIGSLTNGIIPLGQGFFIHANAANPAITIPVEARVHSSQAYYKNSRSGDLTKMSLRAIYDNDYYDELNIAFVAGAHELYEGYDTRKMFSGGSAPQVYALIPDEELSLNSLPELKPGDERTVIVGFKAGVNGPQTLVADLTSLNDTYVLLEDLKLNRFQSLNDNPVYNFEATTYQNPARFVLHFNRSTTGINNLKTEDIRIYTFDKCIYIISKGDMANQPKHLTVYDMAGRMVMDKPVGRGEVIRTRVNLSNSYVLVRVISDSKVYTSKVFIK